MNNEPVAWMLADKEAEHIRSIMAVQHDFVPEGCVEIPLYTHPVKEDEGKVCARCGAIAYDPVITQTVKELTDEEILDLCPPNHSDMMNEAYTIEFARAILRKAQENG